MEQNTGMIDKRKFMKKKLGILICSMLFLLVTMVVSGCSGNNAGEYLIQVGNAYQKAMEENTL